MGSSELFAPSGSAERERASGAPQHCTRTIQACILAALGRILHHGDIHHGDLEVLVKKVALCDRGKISVCTSVPQGELTQACRSCLFLPISESR